MQFILSKNLINLCVVNLDFSLFVFLLLAVQSSKKWSDLVCVEQNVDLCLISQATLVWGEKCF